MKNVNGARWDKQMWDVWSQESLNSGLVILKTCNANFILFYANPFEIAGTLY